MRLVEVLSRTVTWDIATQILWIASESDVLNQKSEIASSPKLSSSTKRSKVRVTLFGLIAKDPQAYQTKNQVTICIPKLLSVF
jgi:hypothetical protein